MDLSEIQKFYRNQTIFLTGATGCLGTLLLEKLTRLCDPEKIHILVRPKKGKSPEERLKIILKDKWFDQVKSENPNFHQKINLITGDLQEPDLGLSDNDRKLLQDQVTLVIHAAANVSFDQSLQKATYNNVRAVGDLINLAKNMSSLQSFVHVSTAYSNCKHLEIKEEFYKPPIPAENLLNHVANSNPDEYFYQVISERMVEKYHNTYTFTKSVGEDLIRREGADLPIAIVRPAIIMPAAEGPLPGWLNNFYGVVGITIGMSLGVIRTLCINYDYVCALVPCDYVANNILASGWKAATDREDKTNREIKIYNYCGADKNWITWGDYAKRSQKIVWNFAPLQAVWYIFFVTTENVFVYNILCFLLHTLPAYFIDFILICLRKKPKAVKFYDEVVTKGVTLTNPFRLHNWKFSVDNVYDLYDSMTATDQSLFNFDMRNFDWNRYALNVAKGSRIYLLKDPMTTLKKAQRKHVLLCILHYTLMAILGYLFFKVGLAAFESVVYLADY